jgi:ABC-2 type transport system permease protein
MSLGSQTFSVGTPPTASVLTRYGRLLGVQFRTSAATAMQYRVDFIVEGVIAVLWLGVTLVPLLVVFGERKSVAGWSFPAALVVIGWFTFLKAILEGAVSPSLTAVVERVRLGTLDFILLKPADAQFLVSTAKFEPWRIVDWLGAFAIFAYAFHALGRWPNPFQALVALVLLGAAVLLLYSFWILVISASFFVVKVDNLSYLFGSIFDAARWPIQVFRGVLRNALLFVFTFVFPLAVMTTYPAMALLGTLTTRTAVFAVLGSVVFAALSRLVWLRAIGSYTSASS